MMFPVVTDLARDGIPVTVTCRVLELCRQQYYRWLDQPSPCLNRPGFVGDSGYWFPTPVGVGCWAA